MLRADLDLATTLDLLFGPVYYRLLFSHEPLDEAFAERCIDHVLAGIARIADIAGNTPAPPDANTERNVQ